MGRKKGKGRAVKRARQKFGVHHESDDIKLAPHSMVIHRGNVEKDIRYLINDVRRVMEPFTAKALKVNRKNSLKDFVAIAGPMHVSHLLVFTQTELSDYMKIVRLPRGPTIHFKVEEFSLTNDVLACMKKKHTHQKQYLHQPLLILNGFNTTGEAAAAAAASADKTSDANRIDFHHKLLTTTLQNMFPCINVTKIKLDDIRRCVLFNYNKQTKTIDFRQYNIRLNPVGLSKPVKKLVQEKLPDLSSYQDISEFIEKGGNLSESEAEFDGDENQVKLSQDMNMRGAINLKSTTSAVRLSEIGPRLKLRLIKIEEGVCDGEVLYHDHITKTTEELQVIRENLKLKKKEEKEKKALKSRNAANKKSRESDNDDSEIEETETAGDENNNDGDDDDVNYYKEELGQDPDAEFIKKSASKRKHSSSKEKDSYANKNDLQAQFYLNGSSASKKSSNNSNTDETEAPNKKAKFSVTSSSKSRAAPKAAGKAKFLGFSKKKKEALNLNKNK